MKSDTPICFKYREPDKQEHRALIALSKGKADAGQQTMALALITKSFCATHDESFVPGKEDETSFRCGRGYPGKLIIKYVNKPVTDEVQNEKT